MHPIIINQRRSRLPEGAADAFGADPATAAAAPAVDVAALHAGVGELTLADGFWTNALGKSLS